HARAISHTHTHTQAPGEVNRTKRTDEECSVLFACFFLLGFLVEETPCEHGENMQTPHRKAQERAHLSCEAAVQAPEPPCHSESHRVTLLSYSGTYAQIMPRS